MAKIHYTASEQAKRTVDRIVEAIEEDGEIDEDQLYREMQGAGFAFAEVLAAIKSLTEIGIVCRGSDATTLWVKEGWR